MVLLAARRTHRPVVAARNPGRVDSALGQIPIVLLTVRGARSGVERTVPLLYFSDGDDVILIASSYGRPKFPAWYYNLKANPDVTLEVKRPHRSVHRRKRSPARSATACSRRPRRSTAATAPTNSAPRASAASR